MTSFKRLLFLLFLPFSGQGQTVTIDGQAPELAGMVIKISAFTNPISKDKIELAVDTIKQDGLFALSCEREGIGQVWISINRFSAPIYVEPGKSYSIEITPTREISLIPTWRPGILDYNFTSLDSTDVNAEIIAFDQAYFKFFDQNARLIGNPSFRKAIKSFESGLSPSGKEFTSHYVDYSVAEMKLVGGFAKDELYNKYLAEVPLKLENPSFYHFFNSFYADYFDSYDARFGGDGMANRFSNGLTYKKLDSLLLRDDFLVRNDIRQWVMLKSVKEKIYTNAYSANALNAVLEEIEQAPDSEDIKQAAGKIRRDYQKTMAANLFDIMPAIRRAGIQPNKPAFVLLAQEGSTERKREATVLTRLLAEYTDHYQVIEVILGNGETTETTWPTVFFGSPENLLDDLSIYKLPWYGWMEPDGKLTKGLSKPSEGLEERLYSIRAKAIQENKIKVGQ